MQVSKSLSDVQSGRTFASYKLVQSHNIWLWSGGIGFWRGTDTDRERFWLVKIFCCDRVRSVFEEVQIQIQEDFGW